jgi:hypothetical protein
VKQCQQMGWATLNKFIHSFWGGGGELKGVQKVRLKDLPIPIQFNLPIVSAETIVDFMVQFLYRAIV